MSNLWNVKVTKCQMFIKGTVSIISFDPSGKDGNAPLKDRFVSSSMNYIFTCQTSNIYQMSQNS